MLAFSVQGHLFSLVEDVPSLDKVPFLSSLVNALPTKTFSLLTPCFIALFRPSYLIPLSICSLLILYGFGPLSLLRS